MPTVLRSGQFRFFFYAGDRDEPPHVHVECGEGEAKFWLDPVRLEWRHGIRVKDISRVQGLVEEHQDELLEAWDAFFHG